MDNKQLEQQIEQYRELAKENPKIDVSTLVLNAFQNSSGEQNYLSKKEKRWGYWIALGIPPFGLIFAAKFYFSHKQDGKSSAWVCVALTVFSLLLFVILFKVTLSSSGTSLQQIEQINPQVQQLLQ